MLDTQLLSTLLSTLLLAAPQTPSACIGYSDTTEVTGLISISNSSGPPGHHGLNDPVFAFLTLHLASAICVREGDNADGMEPALANVQQIELNVVDANAYRALRPLVGRRVVCSGRVTIPVSGFHWSSAILVSPQCVPSPSNS